MAVTKKSGCYINEERAWGAYPWDAMAYALYRLGDLGGAAAATERALELEPGNERLRGNMRFYRRDRGDKG